MWWRVRRVSRPRTSARASLPSHFAPLDAGVAALLLATLATSVRAQSPAPLAFAGVSAGTTVSELRAVVAERGGTLRCTTARRDPRVRECRAVWRASVDTAPVALWLSAVDDVAGIVTVSAPATPERVARWRSALTATLGAGGESGRGAEHTIAWVRASRMLRLTWRTAPPERTVSVSLVDGPTLDRWRPAPLSR